MDLVELLPARLFEIALVFARIGAAFMTITGFGEAYVTPRARLALAIFVSLLVVPLVQDMLPPMPAEVPALFALIGGEVIIGAFMGLITQLLISSLSTAGTIIAFQAGMANAFLFNPASAQQSSIPSALLTAMGLALIFVTDLHHLLLIAVIESYGNFPVGRMPPVGDFSAVVTDVIAGSFVMAAQIASPFVFSGLIFYLAIGILSRLIPQVQIFFIALPAQLLKSFAVFLGSLSIMMTWFLQYFENSVETYLRP